MNKWQKYDLNLGLSEKQMNKTVLKGEKKTEQKFLMDRKDKILKQESLVKTNALLEVQNIMAGFCLYLNIC